MAESAVQRGKEMELIWDFDGTLFDTYPLMAQSLRQALLDEGRDVPLEHIRAFDECNARPCAGAAEGLAARTGTL